MNTLVIFVVGFVAITGMVSIGLALKIHYEQKKMNKRLQKRNSSFDELVEEMRENRKIISYQIKN